MDRQSVQSDLVRVRETFRHLVEQASEEDLRRPSNGTRWNNRQLLFHMLLGYLIMWALLVLVRMFGRLPAAVSRVFAGLLNAATVPFDAVNYAGSWLGGSILGRRQMTARCDRMTSWLSRRLDRESDVDLARGMHYPSRWDPFFRDYMTVADIYRYPTQHFDFHRCQLTLDVDETH